MKQITVMLREDEISQDKVVELMDKIGLAAEELGLAVDATFEDVDETVSTEYADVFEADQWEDENMSDDAPDLT